MCNYTHSSNFALQVRGFYLEKTVSKDTSVTKIEIKLKKIEQLQINLDKIAEDYCEIETSESLEIIQLDIEDINQRIETTRYNSNKYNSSKIDKESRKQFELSLKAEVPTFDSIMKFLEKRSAVLENITRIPSTKMIHKNTAMSTKAKSLVVNSKKTTVKPCILCRNSHPLYKCIAFQNMSVECRKKFVSNNKLCINCLRLHYGACMSKYKCTVSGCKGLHNLLLHDSDELCSAVKNHTVGERGIESNSNTTRFEGQREVAVLTYGNKCVLFNTFMIFVKSADGYRIKLRGLLDNASMTCVMREDIARKLGFKFKSANQSITGINGITQSSKYSANIEVSNRDYTFACNVQFSLLPKIIDAIPVSKLNISDLNIPASIELTDSNFHMPGQIDILIGSELFEILNPEQYYLQEGNVVLQNTKFGYLVTGTLLSHNNKPIVV
ncbi:DUF1758 domain-containing protein [Trichonephila clavipes]|nr:DUF1758 domain-containing protein [Trichonephila clavipes]